jgi:ABC-type multidrug transport system fused ATPase/permease subunit
MKAASTPDYSNEYCNILPYQWRFNGVIVFCLSSLSYLPRCVHLLKQTETSNTGCWRVIILYHLDGHCAVVRSILSVLLCFFANWLGQDIVKDIRIKLFKHILSFRMKYFDLVPVGQLVTRSVSDIESIAFFQSGIIYDYKWLNEDGGRIVLCSTWTGSWLGLWS